MLINIPQYMETEITRCFSCKEIAISFVALLKLKGFTCILHSYSLSNNVNLLDQHFFIDFQDFQDLPILIKYSKREDDRFKNINVVKFYDY